MANARTDALIETWRANANLTLSGEEEQQVTFLFISLIKMLLFCNFYQLRAWFSAAAERTAARRQAGQELFTQLQAAVDNNDSARAEELLQRLREGFRQAADARERALDEFDRILRPEQRARVVVYAAQQARESGRPVEQVIDDLFSQASGNN